VLWIGHNRVIYEINDIFVDDLLLQIIYHRTTFFSEILFYKLLLFNRLIATNVHDKLFVLAEELITIRGIKLG
jgi:hypothetical protein